MEEKRIDNETINTKKQINVLYDKIDTEKQKIKDINEMQEDITELTKHLNKCLELIAVSVKGPTVYNELKDMYDNNYVAYRNTSSILDEEINETRSSINKLYEEKDMLEKHNKENLNNENKKEEKTDKEI